MKATDAVGAPEREHAPELPLGLERFLNPEMVERSERALERLYSSGSYSPGNAFDYRWRMLQNKLLGSIVYGPEYTPNLDATYIEKRDQLVDDMLGSLGPLSDPDQTNVSAADRPYRFLIPAYMSVLIAPERRAELDAHKDYIDELLPKVEQLRFITNTSIDDVNKQITMIYAMWVLRPDARPSLQVPDCIYELMNDDPDEIFEKFGSLTFSLIRDMKVVSQDPQYISKMNPEYLDHFQKMLAELEDDDLFVGMPQILSIAVAFAETAEITPDGKFNIRFKQAGELAESPPLPERSQV